MPPILRSGNQIANDRAEGKLVSVDEIREKLQPLASGQLAVLRQKLELEYPTVVAGLDVPAARVYGKRLIDDLTTRMRQLVDQW